MSIVDENIALLHVASPLMCSEFALNAKGTKYQSQQESYFVISSRVFNRRYLWRVSNELFNQSPTVELIGKSTMKLGWFIMFIATEIVTVIF